ncbi:hypothetical protein CRYUN_Cryun04dG0150900 [Craigia yunnanensis]
MAHQHVETNPHFIDPEEITPEQRHYLPDALLPRRGHDQRIPPRGPQDQRPQPKHSRDERPQPLGPSPLEPHHEGQPHLPLHVWVPPVHHEDQRPQSQPQNRQGQQQQPLEMWMPPPSSIQGPAPKKQKRQDRPRKEAIMQPQLHDQHPSASLIRPQGEITEHHPSPGVMTPQRQGRHPHEHRPHTSLIPQDRPTKPLTWFAAFSYIDMGYLLSADLSVLANFTNPNKVSVDFSSMHLDLYFENTVIATQYIEPFSAARDREQPGHVYNHGGVSSSIQPRRFLEIFVLVAQSLRHHGVQPSNWGLKR